MRGNNPLVSFVDLHIHQCLPFFGWLVAKVWSACSRWVARCVGRGEGSVGDRSWGKANVVRIRKRGVRERTSDKISIGAIRPRLEYACPVWSGGNTSKLVKLQELFCRRHQVILPQLQQRFDYHTLVLFFKIKSNLAPPYLTERLPQLSSHCGYNFRKNLYPVPAVKKSSTLTSFFPRSIIL